MNRLSTTTLIQIFDKLHQSEKAECMLVCRKWCGIIATYTLCETVYLTKHKNLLQFIYHFRQDPSRVIHVKRMFIGCLTLHLNPHFISDLFKNLQVIGLNMANRDIVIREPRIIRKVKLESLLEQSGCYFTYEILSTSFCPFLKHLFVNGLYDSGVGSTLISLLVNAPVLTNIQMSGFTLSISDIELLHVNAPLLSYVKLVLLKLKSGPFPTSIAPTAGISTFSILVFDASMQEFNELVRYTKKKYTKFFSFVLKYLGPRWQEDQRTLKNFLNETLLPFTQHMSQLVELLSLHINGIDFDFVEIFEKAGNKVRHLSACTGSQATSLCRLANLNRLRYIQKLCIKFTRLENFEWLKGLESIKVLILESRYKPIIHDLPEARPPFLLNRFVELGGKSIQSLTIIGHPVMVDNFNISSYSLRCLKLCNLPLPINLDYFITNTLAKLEELELNCCRLNGITFKLPCHHLKSVAITEGEKHFKTILLETNNEQHFYSLVKKSNIYIDTRQLIGHDCEHTYASSHSKPFNEMMDSPNMIFSCASVRKFVAAKYELKY